MSIVYIYQSCSPVASYATYNTQIIQTSKLDFTNLPNTFFKDSLGNCWNYLGESDDTYIPPINVLSLSYSGNYFTNVVDIVYPTCDDCILTTVSACTTVVFSTLTCDSGDTVYVKVCNIGPISGILKLTPTVGQVVGVNNPDGDDFCVTLKSIVTTPIDTEYEINTPAWNDYTCTTCPLYKKYVVNACDGSISGLTVYSPSTSSTLDISSVVNIDIDNICYTIISYEGIVSEYNYIEGITATITQSFDTCDNCLLNYYNTNNQFI
jgi:hypothetical protein